MLEILAIYLLVINLISVIIVAYDKSISKLPRGSVKRVPEKRFILFSLLGGCFGTVFAMLIIRHKTKSHDSLLFKIICCFLAWSAILIFLLV